MPVALPCSVGDEAALSYWRARLPAEVAGIKLPLVAGTPSAPGRSERQPVSIPAPVARALAELAGREQVDVETVLLAAVYALLWRYSAQEELVVGVLEPERQDAQAPGAPDLDLLPVRVVADDLPFPAFVKRVAAELREARAHRLHPYARLIEQLRPAWPPEASAYPSVVVRIDGDGVSAHAPEACPVRSQDPAPAPMQSAMLFRLRRCADGLHGYVQYRADLLGAADAARTAGHLATLLGGIAAKADREISTLPILTDEERHALVVGFNQTARDYPRQLCAHDLVLRTAATCPDKVAVVYGDRRLTYAELDAASALLAARIAARGVQPNMLVGVYLPRGLDLIVALLAVHRAGAAYVPIDPDLPADRVEYMLADSQAAVLVTRSNLLGKLGATSVPAVSVDATDPVVGPVPPVSRVTPADVAYARYTSGSTGRPKGAQVNHGNLVNFLCGAQSTIGMSPSDVVLAYGTISFDISEAEIWWPLTVGAQVVVIDCETAKNGELLRQTIEHYGITRMITTPVTWRLLLADGWEGRPGLKVITGGEALTRELTEALLPRVAELWNAYGPTETTVWSCIKRVEAVPAGLAAPIGRPHPNQTMYIVDKHLNPVPIGVEGELVIGGSGVGRGYLKRPELTAERFIPDHFSNVPGARLYHSGDLARFYPDGDIDFVGRGDFQIKIRGYRVELGEIESVLGSHPRVRQAVVVARKLSSGEMQLVGYVAMSGDRTNLVRELRELLASKLPVYMVPSAIVCLDAFPLTPTLKVDRNALPAPDREATIFAERSFVAPRTETERTIAEIMAEVMGVDRIGCEDDLFEFGANSMQKALVATKCTRRGVRLTMEDIFVAQTIAELATRAAQHQQERGSAPIAAPVAPIEPFALCPIDRAALSAMVENPADIEDAFPITATQRIFLRDTVQDTRPGMWNELLSFVIEGPLDLARFRQAWEEVIARHPGLRTTFLWRNPRAQRRVLRRVGQTAPEATDKAAGAPGSASTTAAVSLDAPLQVVWRTPRLDWRELDWTSLGAREFEAQRFTYETGLNNEPIDLEKGPTNRVSVIRQAGDRYVVLWTFAHHSLDGYSVLMVLNEVFAAYEAGPGNLNARLGPAPSFRDYVGFVKRTDWSEADRHFGNLLAGARPIDFSKIEVPVGRRTKMPAGFHSMFDSCCLFDDAADRITAWAHDHRLSPATLIYAVWSLLLSRISGQDDIVFSSTMSGRDPAVPGVDRMVGMLVTFLPLRVHMDDTQPVIEWLRAIQTSLLRARPYEAAEFDPPLTLGGQSLPFDAWLTYQDFESTPIQAPKALRVSEFATSGNTPSQLLMNIHPTHPWRFFIIYDAERFQMFELMRQLDLFQSLLFLVLEDSDQPLGKLRHKRLPFESGVGVPCFEGVR